MRIELDLASIHESAKARHAKVINATFGQNKVQLTLDLGPKVQPLVVPPVEYDRVKQILDQVGCS